jgi:predicted nucleotidyltransferase
MSDAEITAGPPRVPVDEIRRRIQEHLEGTRVVRAILFGSFARGDADVVSDVDLVLIEPTTAPFVERGLRHLPLFRMGVGVDLLVYTPEEYEKLRREGNPLIERVEEDGVTVYARP